MRMRRVAYDSHHQNSVVNSKMYCISNTVENPVMDVRISQSVHTELF